jgi:hypothetical protein
MADGMINNSKIMLVVLLDCLNSVTHGLNLQILTAELGSIPWLSRVLPAEWRNGGMMEWRNGGMADHH